MTTSSEHDRVLVPKEDWLRLIEDRFCYAVIADILASTRGRYSLNEAEAAAEEYLSEIRPIARKYAHTIIHRGAWSDYANFLAHLPDLIGLYVRPSRRGPKARTAPKEVLTTLRRYDEIMLAFQAGESAASLITRYAPDLSSVAATELGTEKEYVVAAKLAVHGTPIRWNTLLYRYSPKYKTGRLHSITNDLGSWYRKGKQQASYRWNKVVGPDGREEITLEAIE